MKLLCCPNCREIFSLSYEVKQCLCGATKGQYEEDGLHAWYTGGIPLGFDNHSFVYAVALRRKNNEEGKRLDRGNTFDAFIIPDPCPTMVKK